MPNDPILVTVTFVHQGDDYDSIAETVITKIFDRPTVSKGTLNTKLILDPESR